VTRRIQPPELGKLLASLRGAPGTFVSLALPRFQAAFEADLVEPFQNAGIALALADNADFSGMTGKRPAQDGVKIGQIRHRAIIEVAEEGTEAAGATAVVMQRAKSMPPKRPEPVPFIVDRPFLFYVVDDASGAILFQGRIVDPRR
jgi:serpin B